MTYILGISAFYHDSAATLLYEGKIISAVQEERFTRKKHDSAFPKKSIEYILKNSNINLDQIEHVVFYDKPFLKFERLIETYLGNVPKGFLSFRAAIPIWLREKLFLKSMLKKQLKEIDKKFDSKKLLFSEHHFSHAASAYYPSPFEEAIVLTLDGVGEWSTSSVAIGKKNNLEIIKEIHFPHSLGLLYSAFTFYTGFKVNSGEYKLMGLAPYGKPVYEDIIRNKLVDLKNDGSFRLNQKYFNYMTGLTMINKKFENLFKYKSRLPSEKIEQFHMDIAASIQKVTEDIIIKITNSLYKEYKIKNLCLAGGVALNCVANGKILNEKKFKNIWIQPAAGDAGGSLGAAYAVWYKELNRPLAKKNFPQDKMNGSYLGPQFNENEIENTLNSKGAIFKKNTYNEIIEKTARDLSTGKAVGWFQGKMEFGPRSLGSRSILADPRSMIMQRDLNLKVKFRESFRPFAPSILKEDCSDWFDIDCESPYMLLVAFIKNKYRIKLSDDKKKLFGISKLNTIRSKLPAITHVDYSARIQTVDKNTNPLFHKLLSKFKELTGVPVLVNTSFNVRGEPIVCSPENAYDCFMGTNLDILVIENFYLKKNEQNSNLFNDYKNKYELD